VSILLLGHRFDTIGNAPLIKDIEFGGLIADKVLIPTGSSKT